MRRLEGNFNGRDVINKIAESRGAVLGRPKTDAVLTNAQPGRKANMRKSTKDRINVVTEERWSAVLTSERVDI